MVLMHITMLDVRWGRILYEEFHALRETWDTVDWYQKLAISKTITSCGDLIKGVIVDKNIKIYQRIWARRLLAQRYLTLKQAARLKLQQTSVSAASYKKKR